MTTGTTRIPTWADWVVVMGIFLAGVLVTLLAGRGDPPTRRAALLATAATAATTFVVTAWSVRFARYPRWAYWSSAIALSVLAFLGAALVPDLRLWQESLRSSLWMNPWYPLVLTTVAARPGTGACAAGTTLGGWLMVAAAVVLGSIPVAMQWAL